MALLKEAEICLSRGWLRCAEQTQLAATYITSLGHCSSELLLRGIEDVFLKVEGLYDTFTTNTHCSLAQLRVVENAVLALSPREKTMHIWAIC